ncbi:MAG: hypothetical protein U9Q75_12835 [Pseudomonadota bacterium]|nr:hypothetical protein [Pseudomonadota bacterium]
MNDRIDFLEKQIAARKAFSVESSAWIDENNESQAELFFSSADKAYLDELERELAMLKEPHSPA